MKPSMKSLMTSVGIVLVTLTQGCTTSPQQTALAPGHVEPAALTNSVSPVDLCATGDCSASKQAARGAEIAKDKNAPLVEGHPLTAVVVTQCNLVVAVYMTMNDGRLLRFDKTATVPAEQLVSIAYTATHSERVEVSCEGIGAVGYEKHGAV